ncbi:MAG: thioesterase family protein [Candidatus Nanopelagicales bacterium]|nr:thioesterase family protein [Candidatus Nanopelagicales bacterium]
MPDSLELLELVPAGDGRLLAPMPEGSPEGRDVIFGGQIIAQMIMAASADASDPKVIKSIHVIFARAGTYETPLHYEVEDFQNGRTFGSKVITAMQGDRRLAKAMVLTTAVEPDLIAHGITPPSGVAAPDPGLPSPTGSAFPGALVQRATPAGTTVNGVPASSFWSRMPVRVDAPAAGQAVLAWTSIGSLIGLAMEQHTDEVSIEDAHHSLSTGVIAHTLNFHRPVDAHAWLQFAEEASFAGGGRVHGRGAVFDAQGALVATYAQDSMVKRVDETALGFGTRARM